MAAPYSKYLSNFLTTLPSRSNRTTFNALNRLPIPCGTQKLLFIRRLRFVVGVLKIARPTGIHCIVRN